MCACTASSALQLIHDFCCWFYIKHSDSLSQRLKKPFYDIHRSYNNNNLIK